MREEQFNAMKAKSERQSLSVNGAESAAGFGPPSERGTNSQPEPLGSFTRIRVKDCDKEPDPELRPFKAVRSCCRCRFCPECAVGIGLALREKLIPCLAQWHAVLMLSLTVNPKRFVGPEKAFRFIREKRFVARLIRELFRGGLLKSKRFFSVLEFQKETEFPHWHVLVESSFIAHEVLERVWNQLGNGTSEPGNPSVGFVWISKKRFASPEHAARYSTKYVIKSPEQGWPAWVLDFDGQIHRSSHSRGLFVIADGAAQNSIGQSPKSIVRAKPKAKSESPHRKISRSARQRVHRCGVETVILQRTSQLNDRGRFNCRFVVQLPVPFARFAEALECGSARQLFLTEPELEEVCEVLYEQNVAKRKIDLGARKVEAIRFYGDANKRAG